MDHISFKNIQLEVDTFVNKLNTKIKSDHINCVLSYEDETTYTLKYDLDTVAIDISFIFKLINIDSFDLQLTIIFNNTPHNYYIHKSIITLLNIENNYLFDYNKLDSLLNENDTFSETINEDFIININSDVDYFYKLLKTINRFITSRHSMCSICLTKPEEELIIIDNDIDTKYKLCNTNHCIEQYNYNFIKESFLGKQNTSKIELVNIMIINVFISNRRSKLITLPPFILESDIPLIILQLKEGVHLHFTKPHNFNYFKKYIKLYKLYLYFIYQIKNYNFDEQQLDIALKGCKVFKVTNGKANYDMFEGKDYLCHGSVISNWYSIFANGLQVGNAETGTLLNGAAYGKGVYLASDASLSLQYCKSHRVNNDNDSFNSEHYILCMFQVLKPYETYKKTSTIYVVPNSNEVVIQYLFLIDSTADHNKILNYIRTKYNNDKIKEEETTTLELISKMQHPRLKKELTDLMQNDPVKTSLYITTYLNTPSNINVLDIDYNIQNIPSDNILYKQLLDKKIDNIKLQISIPKRYPFEPPFVRVVYPRFKFRTGHITLGGSICMEVLSNKGWMPAMNIHNLLLQIKLLIINGDAQLDDTNWNKEYTLSEAKTAFKRMSITHGW